MNISNAHTLTLYSHCQHSWTSQQDRFDFLEKHIHQMSKANNEDDRCVDMAPITAHGTSNSRVLIGSTNKEMQRPLQLQHVTPIWLDMHTMKESWRSQFHVGQQCNESLVYILCVTNVSQIKLSQIIYTVVLVWDIFAWLATYNVIYYSRSTTECETNMKNWQN